MLSVNKNVLSGSVPCLENKITFIWGSYVHDWPNPAVSEAQVMKPRIDVNSSCGTCHFGVCQVCPIQWFLPEPPSTPCITHLDSKYDTRCNFDFAASYNLEASNYKGTGFCVFNLVPNAQAEVKVEPCKRIMARRSHVTAARISAQVWST